MITTRQAGVLVLALVALAGCPSGGGASDPGALAYAVTSRDLDEVTALLADGADPSALRDGRTPLGKALIMPDEHTEAIVLALVGAGANVDVAEVAPGETITALAKAATNFQSAFVTPAMVRALAQRTAQIDAPGQLGHTALYAALQVNRLDLAEVLLECGAGIDARNGEPNPSTPLVATLGLAGTVAGGPMGSTQALRWVLEHGADPNLRQGDFGRTALHLAKRPDDVRVLLEYGADPTLEDEAGDTPLELTFKSKADGVEEKRRLLQEAEAARAAGEDEEPARDGR